MTRWSKKKRQATAIGAVVMASVAIGVGTMIASDHQDTPEVELSPRSDINDVFAFPAGLSSADNIVLAMTISSPILPGAGSTSARFDPAILYQFKIDNNGDRVEDQVIQLTFGKDTTVNGQTGQAVFVRGPAAPVGMMAPDGSPATPPLTGSATVPLRNVPVMIGTTNNAAGFTGGTGNTVRVFAGLRDDPFFIDLEQFFRIIPDRKPVTGDLSKLPETPTASGFRNPGVEFLSVAKANALAIVIELPKSALGGGPRLGIWGTTSR